MAVWSAQIWSPNPEPHLALTGSKALVLFSFLIVYVTLDKLLELSEPQFPHLYNSMTITLPTSQRGCKNQVRSWMKRDFVNLQSFYYLKLQDFYTKTHTQWFPSPPPHQIIEAYSFFKEQNYKRNV